MPTHTTPPIRFETRHSSFFFIYQQEKLANISIGEVYEHGA